MRRHVSILILFVTTLSACSDSTTNSTNSGNSGNGPTGTLKGVVSLYDTNNVELTDRSGLKVEVVGTSYSAVTDAAGVWTISDLPTKTYNISFSKSGYPTYKMQQPFVGGATVWIGTYRSPWPFTQRPVFSVTLDGIFPPTVQYFDSASQQPIYTNGQILGHFSKNTPDYTIAGARFSYAIAVGHSPKIDITDETSYAYIIEDNSGSGFKRYTPDSIINFAATLYYGSYEMKGFASGETMYIRAYPVPRTYLEHYFDPETGRLVYSNVGKGSEVLSVVIP